MRGSLVAAALAGSPPEDVPQLGETDIFGAAVPPRAVDAEAVSAAIRQVAAADVDMAASSVSGLSLLSLPQAQQEPPESVAASFVPLSNAVPAARFSSESSASTSPWTVGARSASVPPSFRGCSGVPDSSGAGSAPRLEAADATMLVRMLQLARRRPRGSFVSRSSGWSRPGLRRQ